LGKFHDIHLGKYLIFRIKELIQINMVNNLSNLIILNIVRKYPWYFQETPVSDVHLERFLFSRLPVLLFNGPFL